MPIQPLPEGAVLLHVGPYKTGSTAIQTRLAQARPELEEHGVAYPAPPRDAVRRAQHRADRPGWAVIGWAPKGFTVPDISVWDGFAAQVRSQTAARACVSTEDFGSTGRIDLAKKIVGDLGGENVHVVYVCRAFHRLLPSHWQERVKSAMDPRTYDEWLRGVLIPEERDEAGEGFWRSHDLDRVAAAWLGAVGQERFTVVATDDSDRNLLPSTFESMLGLPAGFLEAERKSNASLSWNGTELLRRLNVIALERDWPEETYIKLLRGGALRGLEAAGRSGTEVPIPAIPGWAREPVADLGRKRLETIERLGLHVVGDPACLLLPEDAPIGDDNELPTTLSLTTSTSAVGAVFERAFRLERETRRAANKAKKAGRSTSASVNLAETSGQELVRELGRRARSRLGRR